MGSRIASLHPACGWERGAIGPSVIKDGRAGFLTCNHIAAVNGRAPVGSPVGIQRDRGAFEPFGTLWDFDSLDDSRDAINLTDSALVLLNDPGVLLDHSGLGAGQPVLYEPRPARLSGRVIKFGPSSGLTRGRISALDYAPTVYHSFGTYRFARQIIILGDSGQPFAAPGDSGALVFSDDDGEPRQPIAMIWGGRENRAYATPLEFCLKRYGAELATPAHFTSSNVKIELPAAIATTCLPRLR